MTSPWCDRLARLLVSYSLNVQPSDVVLISGAPESEALLLAIFHETLGAQGLPVIRLAPDLCTDVCLCTSGAESFRYLNPLGLPDGRPLDCSIGVSSRQEATHLDYNQPTFQLADAVERIAVDQLLHHAAQGKIRWVSTDFPTEAAARDADLTLAEYEELLIKACMLGQADPAACWRIMHDRQQILCETLEKGKEIRFTTPQGTDLSLDITGRRWLNGDGHGNLPDGEVYSAPHEDSAQGIVCFPFPIRFQGYEMEGIRLRLRDGRVVDASATKGAAVLNSLLGVDPGASRLGEVGLGANPAMVGCTKRSLLDEKMAGTFHVALGSAYPLTGGVNKSALHCDIVVDLRAGGRTTVDHQTFCVS